MSCELAGVGSVTGPLRREVYSRRFLVGFLAVFGWSPRVSLAGLQVSGFWC